MERLTARSPKNNMAYLVNVKPDEQEVDSPYLNTLKCITECFEKLARYEETGLEPGQIEAQQREIDLLKYGKYGIEYYIQESKQRGTWIDNQATRILKLEAALDMAKKAILAVFRETPSQESMEYAEHALAAIDEIRKEIEVKWIT